MYHEAKRTFPNHVLNYGYISSYVRLEQGSLTTRFQYQRPLPSGYPIRINLRMVKGSYDSKIRRNASHEHEMNLALYLEKCYKELRVHTKEINSACRKTRDIKRMKKKIRDKENGHVEVNYIVLQSS